MLDAERTKERAVVIGVDSGGSYTRATCVRVWDRTEVGRGQSGGGNPLHNDDACANVQAAIRAALTMAGREPADVVALVAGIAGVEDDVTKSWASEFTALPGLDCPRLEVNDAVVAHVGTFAGDPGIMVVAGTGSTILGITEKGRHVRNSAFHHYAGAARHLSFDLVNRILLGDQVERDAELVTAVFAHFGVASRTELYDVVAGGVHSDENETKRSFGELAKVITAATTSPLAHAAITALADRTCVGIELVAGAFGPGQIEVCLEGGLAKASAFRAAISSGLLSRGSRCRLVDAKLSPTDGAALMALEAARQAV